ncbi:zinc-binding dehydrogenase [Streptomyces cyaneofuscatus]|uniref:zinc-binding dehydrogenase n=1 Tax=Streptomyces cyaneofuscatus TaxID=66883 RepID=UPI00343EFF85
MRAVAFKEVGGPEVLRTVELPAPEPGPGEVLVASGAVRIDITAEYDLADAPEAQRQLESGRNKGKAVLRIAP